MRVQPLTYDLNFANVLIILFVFLGSNTILLGNSNLEKEKNPSTPLFNSEEIAFACSHSDYPALKALYAATDGANWTNNTNWDTTGQASCDPCNWFGITCTNNRVSTINLNSNHLKGQLPPEIGDLDSLENLHIASNSLNGSIPPELGNLTKLVVLFLSSNQLTGSIPPELGNLNVLWTLALNNNNLTGVIPSELGNLNSLRNLFLYTNQLSGTLPPELAYLTLAQIINLSNNQLEGCIPNEYFIFCPNTSVNLFSNPLLEQQDFSVFCSDGSGACTSCAHLDYPALKALYAATDGANWTNNTNWDTTGQAICDPCSWYGVTCTDNRVTTISLVNNNLVGSIPPELGNLSNLIYMYISLNDLSGTIPPELGNLSNLEYMEVGFNNLSGTIPPELGNLAFLKKLFLKKNNLSGSIPPELGDLTNLENLSVSINNLSGTIPSELGNLTNLEFIYLYSNKLTGSIPAELSNLNNLKELYLYSNGLSGPIPPELGSLSNLDELLLSKNNLSGCIPMELNNFCSNTVAVDLSSNPLLDEQDFSAFCNTGSGACSPPQCPPVLHLTQNPVDDSTYTAVDTIYSEVTIENIVNTITIIYKAGKAINLQQGFEVKAGATFLATIEGCLPPPLQESEPLIAERSNENNNLLSPFNLKIYPNPFNHETTVQFNLSKDQTIQINLYNLNGTLVKSILPKTNYVAGQHQITLQSEQLPPGIYYLNWQSEVDFGMEKLVIQR